MAKSKNRVVIAEDLTAQQCRARVCDIERAIERLQVELAPIREFIAQTERKLGALSSERDQLNLRLETLKGRPVVSDHALVRYLERKYGFDSEAVRKEMLTPEVEAALRAGAAGCKSHGGTFKFRDMTVTTYIHPKTK
ncbi:hypothetical protein [Alteriqipengyuania sp.]|uniref:hypothetical protein n=1 Tax=Alteriqipengyuania sp. TaxID=2800692 RepID=UPI003516464D